MDPCETGRRKDSGMKKRNRKESDLKAAVSAAKAARHNALCRKRAAGDPRNPFMAKAGMELEFYQADRNVRACALILKLLEKETDREAWRKAQPARKRIKRFLGQGLCLLIGTGLAALSAMGFAAAFTLLRFPSPVIQAAAVIGVSAALVRAVSRK